MKRRNPKAQEYSIRLVIWQRDHCKCRWCHEPIKFKNSEPRQYDGMIVGHGLPYSEAPSADDIDNWYTSCFECNHALGNRSIPPLPIPPIEVVIVEKIAKRKEKRKLVPRQIIRVPIRYKPPNFEVETISEYDPFDAMIRGGHR